jgi:hypothetical protein
MKKLKNSKNSKNKWLKILIKAQVSRTFQAIFNEISWY